MVHEIAPIVLYLLWAIKLWDSYLVQACKRMLWPNKWLAPLHETAAVVNGGGHASSLSSTIRKHEVVSIQNLGGFQSCMAPSSTDDRSTFFFIGHKGAEW